MHNLKLSKFTPMSHSYKEINTGEVRRDYTTQKTLGEIQGILILF